MSDVAKAVMPKSREDLEERNTKVLLNAENNLSNDVPSYYRRAETSHTPTYTHARARTHARTAVRSSNFAGFTSAREQIMLIAKA